MAATKKENPVVEEELNFEDNLTIVAQEKKQGYRGPTTRIFLPELESEGNGVKVDQYEHVTIANEEKEQTWYVHRGEWVEVPVPVFVVLKEKYPNL